ncbi:MAG: hypothetical protein HGA37_01135 [Lentimicrobium sp.]|nr:hypothetical protein [Lentimicrobium sp.]
MATFKSDEVVIGRNDTYVFAFLSDFNNFQKLMPPQVTDWKSDGESCSFNIQNMATLGMRFKSKTPDSHIFIQADGKVPFQFDLQCFIAAVDENSCTARLELNADLNPMLMMLAAKPLGNFINMLAVKLKEICDSGIA